MAASGQRSEIDQIWPHKSHFGSTFGSRLSDLDKIWHGHIIWPFKQACAMNNFAFIAKSKMAGGGQRSKLDQIWPHKSHFGSAFESRSSDLDTIWHEHTYCPYKVKQVCARIYRLGQNQRWPLEAKGLKSTKFDSKNHISGRHLDPVHPIWTKFGMDILLDPKNKPVQEFLI
jgi:hypothetical protein